MPGSYLWVAQKVRPGRICNVELKATLRDQKECMMVWDCNPIVWPGDGKQGVRIQVEWNGSQTGCYVLCSSEGLRAVWQPWAIWAGPRGHLDGTRHDWGKSAASLESMSIFMRAKSRLRFVLLNGGTLLLKNWRSCLYLGIVDKIIFFLSSALLWSAVFITFKACASRCYIRIRWASAREATEKDRLA